MSTEKVRVQLYGHLARKFGKVHHYAVSSPAEAIRALGANFPGFRQHLIAHSAPGYHVLVGTQDIGEEELNLHCSPEKVIKFIPRIEGSKTAGLMQTVLGAALIALSFVPYFATFAPALQSAGLAMMAGGVSQMLAGVPRLEGPSQNDATNNKPSYAYDGAVNTTSQGLPVPVCYGMMEVGCAVVSSGIYAEEYQVTEGEPTTGFRIIQPTVGNRCILTAPATTFNVSVGIVFANYTTTPTATITSQTPAGTFSLTGSPGAQTIVASALPAGHYTATLSGTDGVTTTEKTVTFTVRSAGYGGGDGDYDPWLHNAN